MEQTVFTYMPSLLNSAPSLIWQSNWPVCLNLPTLQLNQQDILKASCNPTPTQQLNQLLGFNMLKENESAECKDSKDLMTITKCPHTFRKHYAKNMCNTCYHTRGRNNIAYRCQHAEKPNYAKGYCFNCYFIEYKKQKKGKSRNHY